MSSSHDQKNRRLLIIDDNHQIHEDFRKILAGRTKAIKKLAEMEASLFETEEEDLQHEGFEIDFALQGKEGLERVQRSLECGRPYAMAFIDVRMPPGWDGIETTAQIWKIHPEMQVVICTAYSDYTWEGMVSKLGQSDRLVILKKPFDGIEVRQLTHALTHKWQLMQQAKQKLADLESLVQQRTGQLQSANQALLAEIAERKHSEYDRRMMEVQLRQAQKLEAIGQLAAGIAHEINTPMQYVGDNSRFLHESFSGIAKVLESHKKLIEAGKTGTVSAAQAGEAEAVLMASDIEYLFKQIPAAIEETLEGVERVTKIVRAMKEFSHPGSKEKTPADINRAIETTVTVAHNEWKYTAEMKLDLSPGLPLTPCFIGEFNQCILNLLVNAAHAIGDVVKESPGTKGLITISTLRKGDQVEIRISDTGTGIPEAARPHIFEPFFTTKEVGKGTGQGLSIVYANIVKKHGGTVSFETETGKGTSFIVRLPLKPEATKTEGEMWHPTLRGETGTVRDTTEPTSQKK